MKTLYVGTHGHVRAIDAQTGYDLWDASLPGTGHESVMVFVTGEHVFAASKGKVFRLDAKTGRVLWTNELSGLGFEAVMLAGA